MRIGELAQRAGVSVRSLRYYEEHGLLDADRTGGGHREYNESDVMRVGFITKLLAARLPSRRILEILPFLDTGTATPRMLEHLRDEHVRIEEQIAALTTARDQLAALRVIAEQSVAGRPAEECLPAAAAAAHFPLLR